MKRGILLLLIMAASAQAAPLGPVRPTDRQVRLGFEAFSAHRDLESSRGNASGSENRSRAISYFGKVSYGFHERVEVSLRLGLADLDLYDRTTNFTAFTNTISDQRWNGDFAFAGGLGASGIVYDPGPFNIALAGNVLFHAGHSSSDPFTFYGSNLSPTVDYSEWSLGLAIQSRFGGAEPYIGVRYSGVSIDVDPSRNITFDNKHSLGVYAGSSYEIAPRWSAFVEGQLIDAVAFGGGIEYTFSAPAALPAPAPAPISAPLPSRTTVFFRNFNYLAGPDEHAWQAEALKEVFKKNWERLGVLASSEQSATYVIDGDYSIVSGIINVSLRLKDGPITVKRFTSNKPFDPNNFFAAWTPIVEETRREFF